MSVRGRLRTFWRSARGIRVVGPAVRAADRIWWARAIRRTGLVDSEFYAAQRGRHALSDRRAVAHYVARGFRNGLSLNPLFDEVFAGGTLPEVFRVPAMYAYAVSDRPTVSVHPWWDAVEHGRRLAIDGSGVPALERVWNARDTAEIDLTIAGKTVRVPFRQFREWALFAARAWSRKDFSERVVWQAPERAATTLIRMVQKNDRRYARLLGQGARLAQAKSDTEVVVVLIAPNASQWISAEILARAESSVRVVGCPASTRWADVVADRAAEAAGEVLAVLDPRIAVDDAEIESLVALAHGGAAAIPAVRAFDGTLVGIGAARVGGVFPYRIMEDHPQEDLDALGELPIPVPLLTGRTVALPTRFVTESGGWNRALVNDGELEVLSAALREQDPRVELLVVPNVRPVQEEPEEAFVQRRPAALRAAIAPHCSADSARAEDLINRAGFVLHSWELGRRQRPTARVQWRRPSATSQRWAIKICAPAGPRGEVWGDTHFALGLARALKRRGYFVAIDSFDARARSTAYLDDVAVVVRGPYRIDAPSAGISLQWIISHPDHVTRAEADAFDRVFAASSSWSAAASARWNIPVEPLFECTDTDQFFPRGLPRGEDIVFVGTARGIARPSVVAPLRAGIPVKVYGPDWRPFIPATAIVATSIPNTELPARYETASIVLNDQWPAMRREGFIAMRPFDAVAVGGRVVSESVEGINDIFGRAVVTYEEEADLVELLRQRPDELFPCDEELALISERIRRDHSFDARATVLVAAAQAALSVPAQAQR